MYYVRMHSGTPFLSTFWMTLSSSFFKRFPNTFSASSASVISAGGLLALFFLEA